MRRLFALLGIGLLATACSTPAPQPPPQLPPAAEPAVAPGLTATPAGVIVQVGDEPEGIVADGVSRRVAVGLRNPDRLGLLDAASGAVVTTVPLPGHLRHLQLAAPGGPVLVPDEDSGRLLTVALPSGKITSSVPTGASPHDATRAADGRVFAANEAGGSVAVVENGKVLHTFTDVTQPAGLAPVGNLVGLVDVRQNDLSVYDAATLTRVARLPAGAGPTHVVADRRGHFVVIDTRGGGVLTFDPAAPAHALGRLALPGTPYGVAYDATRDRLWVTLTAKNQLVGIDLTGPAPRVISTIPTVRQPNTVAVDPATGTRYVTGTANGVVEVIPPS
ncbi:YncE family protein [Amycolatopsis saalfeldensis]|uniref:DNA-binding beta-propeller fold protein YncE n=1 Tax=Amycolatopsis saalfeldensis TaxID=394193 RepID=A0A1H8U5S3_9PSEU|nr:YncE family protein [Amycolatopsis saalfeldensis]SEO98630.1 DNA-binding beta-propeller fold protein YncE [Amycolatopsis saalfeldensis]